MRLKRWLPFIILLAAICAAWLSGVHEYISLATIQAHKLEILAWTNEHFLLALILGFIIYVAATALSLPFATLLTLLAGFLFGRWTGTLLVVCAATAGAIIIFLVARSSMGKSLRERAGPFYQKVERHMREDAAGYILFLRLVPVFPFVLVNILPALFNVRLSTYAWTTFFGIMPGTFVYVNFGEALGDINTASGLLSGEMLLAFTLLGIMALLPTLYKKLKKRKGS